MSTERPGSTILDILDRWAKKKAVRLDVKRARLHLENLHKGGVLKPEARLALSGVGRGGLADGFIEGEIEVCLARFEGKIDTDDQNALVCGVLETNDDDNDKKIYSVKGLLHSYSFDRYVDALIAGGRQIVEKTDLYIYLKELPNYETNARVLIEQIQLTFVIVTDRDEN